MYFLCEECRKYLLYSVLFQNKNATHGDFNRDNITASVVKGAVLYERGY
jgi:hypothetical protein